MSNETKKYDMSDFKEALKEFLNENSVDSDFNEKWDNAINKWKEYREKIKSDDLPLIAEGDKSWAKSNGDDTEYLVNFLQQEVFFGGCNVNNQEQVMIFNHPQKETDKDKEYKSEALYCKYDLKNPDGVSKEKAEKCYYKCNDENKEQIEKVYKANIVFLLKEIVNAETLEAVIELEQKQKYCAFISKQSLRKMVFLESMSRNENDDLYNSFMWVCKDGALEDAAQRLGADYKYTKNPTKNEQTFFYHNQKMYAKMKDAYAEVKKELADEKGEISEPINVKAMTREQIYELYRFICSQYFRKQNKLFTDFNNINVIFNGAPGTGKTYTVSQDIKALNNLSDLYTPPKVIQFHPSYTYQDFIEGIKPMGIDENGNLKLQVVNGSFKELCIKVRKENEVRWQNMHLDEDNEKKNRPNKDNPKTLENWPHYYFVVDEINRGNLSNIFGETFTLLEYRDYDFSGTDGIYDEQQDGENSSVSLTETVCANVIKQQLGMDGVGHTEDLYYKKIIKADGDFDVKFGIPFNIHFIGMMNDVDKSIDSFDLAFRRRFRWEPMYCDYKAIFNVLAGWPKTSSEEWISSVKEFVRACMKLNYYVTGIKSNLSKDFGLDETAYKKSKEYGRVYEIGQGYFLKIKNVISQGYKKIGAEHRGTLFDNYIAGTIKEYIRQMEDNEKTIEDYLKEARNAFVGKTGK